MPDTPPPSIGRRTAPDAPSALDRARGEPGDVVPHEEGIDPRDGDGAEEGARHQLHDPAVIRKILAHFALGHSGRSPGRAPPESGAAAS